jgi:hypothetical protein
MRNAFTLVGGHFYLVRLELYDRLARLYVISSPVAWLLYRRGRVYFTSSLCSKYFG